MDFSTPRTIHGLIATGLWAISLTLLIGATIWPMHEVLAWSLFTAIVAAVFTGCVVVQNTVEREQDRAAVRVSAAVARAVADERVDRI